MRVSRAFWTRQIFFSYALEVHLLKLRFSCQLLHLYSSLFLRNKVREKVIAACWPLQNALKSFFELYLAEVQILRQKLQWTQFSEIMNTPC